MTATYTGNLRLTKQGDNDNPNTWGSVLNEQVIELLEDAVAGVVSIDVTGSSDVDISATAVTGGTDDARHATIEITGTISTDIQLIVPSVNKQYFIRASHTGGTVTVIPSGGSTGIDLVSGDSQIVYTSGSNIYPMVQIPEVSVTGDMEPTFRSSAKSGWLFLQGQTLGSSTSGATLAGDTYRDLFIFMWNNVSDTYCPVSGGRGSTAEVDWSSNKTLTLVDTQDRTPFGAGSTWGLGQADQGDEDVTLVRGNLPSETLSISGTTNTTGSHTHTEERINRGSGSGSYGNLSVGSDLRRITQNTSSSGSHSHSFSATTDALGSDEEFSILPKGFGVNWMIKL